MPDTRPDLTGVAAVVVTACPLLAAHLTALHPGLRTALLTRLAGIGTLCDRDGLLLTSYEPAAAGPAGNGLVTTTIYFGTDSSDVDVWARVIKLRAREVSWFCPTRTRSWSPCSPSTWARRHDHCRAPAAYQPHRDAAPQRGPRRRQEETAAFGYRQSARSRPLRRRGPSAVLETAGKPQPARRRPGRHDLLSSGQAAGGRSGGRAATAGARAQGDPRLGGRPEGQGPRRRRHLLLQPRRPPGQRGPAHSPYPCRTSSRPPTACRCCSTPACATAADVAKAIALGADAVGVGRPYAYTMAVGGEDVVVHYLCSVPAETDLLMAVDGYPDLAVLRAAGLQRVH